MWVLLLTDRDLEPGARMSAPLEVAIAGCGRITEVGYLPALARTPTVRLVGVVDPDGERCARVAPNVPAYPDLGAARGGRPDLIVIAAPAAAHLPLAREAADAGVGSLVEKPPAHTLADTVALAALEPAPFMGFNRRFDPDLSALRDRVREGRAQGAPARASSSRSRLVRGGRTPSRTVRCSTWGLMSSTSHAGSPGSRLGACGRWR